MLFYEYASAWPNILCWPSGPIHPFPQNLAEYMTHRSCSLHVVWIKGCWRIKNRYLVKTDWIFIQVRKQKRRRWEEMEDQIKTNYWDPLGYSSFKSCTSTWLHPSCKLFLVNFIDWLLIMPKPRILLGKQPKTQSCYHFSRTPHHNSAWPTALTSQLVSQLLPSPWL